MAERVLHMSDRIARRAAIGITRRRLLRNSGGAALSFALGSAFLSGKMASNARAHGSVRHPCGPSPYCPKGRCYHGNCSNAPGRVYATYHCNPHHNGGCWTEDYRDSGNGLWHCCDCCAVDGGGARCSRCGDSKTRRACICRRRL
jgi:hypothetical protein